jgi:hypothetical protein
VFLHRKLVGSLFNASSRDKSLTYNR